MAPQAQVQFYRHGRFRVQGGVLPDAVTAYCTYGDPADPCIVFPTCYGGRLDGKGLLGQDYMIGPDMALDPSKYFIVTFALFCNGESSSPSNTPAPYNGPYFPSVSYEDNIRAQYTVLTKVLGIKEVFCVIGFSMGGQQAYYWSVCYPDFVKRFVCICGSARTSNHNACFLEGPKAALLASKDFDNGHYKSVPQVGIRAFGRVYSAWAYGQAWYRANYHLYNGTYPDLNAFLREVWEFGFLSWDANDLLALMHTWQTGDVSTVQDGGDLGKCLTNIKAKGLIMPCKTDLYFPPEDNDLEVQYMKGKGKFVVIDSIWGHMAGGGSNESDHKFIQDEVKRFFEEK
ncbi:homoserine acetyltransferase family protein [Moniliophthora roreri MCA 2997]|uniref:Homoserine acetyltransferase family protein n=1 Tax=Moniliophthora roreri (strain MCA 2997) TaxID=1381753 RepID=V2XTH2_MONRO|nr:homoserine acetyltransferase family protein [Moniliophthora roreri MCA 2997]